MHPHSCSFIDSASFTLLSTIPTAQNSALKTCDTEKETCEKELKKLLERREGLRGDKDKMEEKERLKAKAETLKKCYSWMVFRRDQLQAKKLRDEKQAKEHELEAAGVTIQPYTTRAEGFRALVESAGILVKDGQALWKKGRAKIDACCGNVEPASDALQDAGAAVEELEQRRAFKEKERSKVQAELQEALALPSVNVEEMKDSIAKLTRLGRDAKRTQDDKGRVVGRLKQDMNDVNKEIYDLEQRKKNEERQENQRLNRLKHSRHLGPNARTACEVREWVHWNGGRFSGRVYGPLILEMSVEDRAVAAMVEQQCTPSTQLTFVVENDEDKKTLVDEWKTNRKAKIVVQQLRKWFWGEGGGSDKGQSASLVRSGSGWLWPCFSGDFGLSIYTTLSSLPPCPSPESRWREDLKREFYNPGDLAQLEKEGIKGIMLDHINAPDQVLSALCTQANVHRVLIGNDHTEQRIANGFLEQLCRRGGSVGQGGDGGKGGGSAVVYTERKDGVCVQHRGTISHYSNKLSTASKLSKPPEVLGEGATDEEEARELSRKQKEYERVIAEGMEKAAKLQAAIRDREEEQNTAGREATKLQKEQSKLQARIKEAMGVQNTVKRLEKKLAEIEAEMEIDVSQQRADLEKKMKAAAKGYVDVLCKHTEEVVSFVGRWERNLGGKMAQAMGKSLSRGADQELKEQSQKHEGLKEELEVLNRDYRALIEVIKKAKGILERDVPLKGPKADGSVIDMLGGELDKKTCEECQNMYEEALQHAESIYDNPAVIAQYKELVKQVAAREKELAEHMVTCSSGQKRVDDLAKKWKDALKPLVAKLHMRFGEYMRQMGCEGEVVLAEEPDDYERWGLVLRVRFREGTTLQPLQAKVQSGGERSVSTILFLMGLQSTVASPFRAVDEINQGMDERNERLVFSRIVANSANVQYFLVTPKLLPGLTAMEMEHVTVLFVFNAPELLPFDKWSVKGFLEAARRKRGMAGGGGGSSKRGRSIGGGAARNRQPVDVDDSDE